MDRIVVIGASGFIGRQLVRQLQAAGHQVQVFIHRHDAWTQSLPSEQIHRVDITDPGSLRGKFKGVDTVFHLAGALLARSAEGFHLVNAVGTENVARACAACDSPPRLLFVSSLAALGPTTADAPLDEDADPKPVSGYGRSKLAAEQLLTAWADKLPISIVRPPSVLGPEDRYMLGALQWAARGWVLVPDSQQHRYSFTHVEDLCAAMIAVANQGRRLSTDDPLRGCYHVADRQSLTFAELTNLVTEQLQRRRPRAVTIPRWLMQVAGVGGEVIDRIGFPRPFINRDKVREAVAGSWICNATKLHQQSLYTFPYSLTERVHQTVEGYRSAGKL
ncbi:NAD-dependent epimerase/dehydratase family protein [Roseimaritima ulvae]|uniref:dTDP-4-dehydrorhamnose reductase n=1 Tax=Roseimaritima ulvae TaxID=980254 RepID=A0A5B9QRX1_9BACT|nr:NAD-dependent epimerase/dehydratase family protein [Roseimaritima ulvae]QEG40702.1 dTDP-4-dehydrorhamnose reductase [Roseimaritima ulvae]